MVRNAYFFPVSPTTRSDWGTLLMSCNGVKVFFTTFLFYFEGFFSSWSDSKCFFSSSFTDKLSVQSWLWKGFLQSWTDLICLFSLLFCEKLCTLCSHSKSFFSSWPDSLWFFKYLLLKNTKFAMEKLHSIMNWFKVHFF